MAKLTFKTDKCKGCGLCVDVCPKKVLILSPSGFPGITVRRKITSMKRKPTGKM